MLIFRKRRATIIRIPTVALMLAGLWAMVATAVLASRRSDPRATLWLAVVVAAVFALGLRIIRRVGDEIVVTGLVGASRHVPARHAVLRVHMRAVSKYAHLALDLMPHPDLEVPTDLGNPDVVTLDDFQPSGTETVMRAARRAANLLGLPEPMLGPGLIGSPGRTPQPGAADTGKRFDLRGGWAALRHHWAVTDKWTRLIVVACIVSVAAVWVTSRLHPGTQLILRCDGSWNVRDPSPTFNFTCQGSPALDVTPGPTALEVWDPDRLCWVERKFVVPKNGARVFVDEVVKFGRCSGATWPLR